MNTAREPETGQASLWARVRDWFATWTAVFTPDEILRDGLSRRFALRCCNWLWPLEATVRRLIIAAALALDPAILNPPSQQQRSRRPEKPAQSPPGPTGFRIVSIRGAGAPRVASPATRTTARTEQHLPFASDDLLRLGPARPPQARKIVVHHDNPLRRHCIRRSDPDYIPGSEHDYANSSELLFGSRKDREPPPERGSAAGRSAYFRVPLQSDDDSEWRRIEKEWERVLPAPGIAARITALAGVLNSPGPHIQRLARRLAASSGLAALLRDAPPPRLRKPRYDPFGPQVDEDLTMLAYATVHPPDTS